MSNTLPAMKGCMGNTEYYILSIKVNDLVNWVKEPKNMPGWDDEKIEEIYQRKIQYNRVRKQIAPYLAQNPDSRFFGSLIVAAFNFDEKVMFEPLHSLPAVSKNKLSGAQQEAASKIGMLTLHGGVMMVPLDGQHRLKALEFAVTGKDERGKDIPGIDVDPVLANEDISVILVPYEPEKARRIFTRVNRYARRPTTNETYVTDDDDMFAVLARKVANRIGGRLVKYTSTTLTTRDPQFTTLSALYASCKEIVKCSLPSEANITTEHLPDQDIVDVADRMVLEVWDRLLSKITVFSDLTTTKSEEGDDARIKIRKDNLLGKPVPQECLVSAYMALVSAPTNLPWETACERLNAIPWAITNENVENIWQYVLWTGGVKGKIITKNRGISSRLIAYMAGEKLNDDELGKLLDDYRNLFPEAQHLDKHLPDRIPN